LIQQRQLWAYVSLILTDVRYNEKTYTTVLCRHRIRERRETLRFCSPVRLWRIVKCKVLRETVGSIREGGRRGGGEE
jgi:hypothetical protein